MLRTIFRSRRTPLNIAKAASTATGPGQRVVLHNVRIRPRARLRNLAIGVGVTFVCYSLYTTVVLGPLARYLDRELDEIDDKELENSEPLFIAFPLTTRTVEPLPYKGTDEEWRSFVRVSKDRELQGRIRHELANIVRTVAENSTLLSVRMGKDLRIRRWWMDVDFPFKPPPEFVRSGIEISYDGFEWATRPVDSTTVFRTQRILYPSPMALSMFAFAGTLFRENVFALARMLGYEPKNTPPPTGPNPIIERTLRRFQAQSKPVEPAQEPGELPTTKRQTPDGNAATGSSRNGPPQSQRPTISTSTPSHPDGMGPPSAKDLIPHSAMTSITSGPWAAFRKKMGETWRPMRDLPPRGCIMVSGLVELESSRAFVVIDVFAWWNPKTGKYDYKSMWLGLRRVQNKQQGPLR